MAAHGAVVSLLQLLRQLSESDHFPKPEIQSLHDNVFSLQSSLERIFPVTKRRYRSKGKDLEAQIRDAVYKAQDAIESFLYGQNLMPDAEKSSTSVSLPEIIAAVDSVREEAEKVAAEIGHGKEDLSQPCKPISGGKSSRIVGQDQDKKLVTDELVSEDPHLNVVPITGMPGIGKTTLARSIYEDANTKSYFSTRAWVTVTQDYSVGEILTRLLNSMESKGWRGGEKPVSEGRDEKLRVILHQALFNSRYLIVVDDMWDVGVWDKLRISLPENKNQSRVLLTTRISDVADFVKTTSFCHVMKPLGEEHSWTLLCEKAFGGMHFPPYLEETGKKIAANCRGLPLSITVIGGLLSKERPTIEDWQVIEEDTHAATAKGEESYLEILSLSYDHLPGKLKACFLYMGAFPEDSEMLVSKLIKLWVAEGFLKPPPPPRSVEMVAEKSLEELVDRNLLRVRRISSDGRVKTCEMHDSLHDLAIQECGKEKFFHSIKRNDQSPKQGSHRSQRRVSVHMNILIMCYPDVYDSTKSVTAARTLLYAGIHHHHPIPSCLTFDLLRVLDAYTVYFIRFPSEVIRLIHLRYLSMTYGGMLPSSLAKLRNLQVLILRREPKTVFVGVTILPDEIWSMPQLRHLVLEETDFPKKPERSYYPLHAFANLQSLSDVHAVSCTREVLQNMPTLKKLAMWSDAPGAIGLYLDELNQLEVFKFTVLNPDPGEKVEFQPRIFFPETLRKLSLRGCGLPWEDMEIIGNLPNLQVLKLRGLAFQGEEWCPTYSFEKLRFLLLEYLDLKIWEASYCHFPILESLILRYCYELEEISAEIGYIGKLELIELVDCSPSAVECAEEISEEQKSFGNTRLNVRIFSSWE